MAYKRKRYSGGYRRKTTYRKRRATAKKSYAYPRRNKRWYKAKRILRQTKQYDWRKAMSPPMHKTYQFPFKRRYDVANADDGTHTQGRDTGTVQIGSATDQRIFNSEGPVINVTKTLSADLGGSRKFFLKGIKVLGHLTGYVDDAEVRIMLILTNRYMEDGIISTRNLFEFEDMPMVSPFKTRGFKDVYSGVTLKNSRIYMLHKGTARKNVDYYYTINKFVNRDENGNPYKNYYLYIAGGNAAKAVPDIAHRLENANIVAGLGLNIVVYYRELEPHIPPYWGTSDLNL
jgi:hypothetical protein